MATGTILDSIIELNNIFVLASQKENTAFTKYKDAMAWENELERQYNYHLANNDSYNANIIKPQLNTQRGVRENLGREWETAKTATATAYKNLETAKKNLSSAETSAVNSQLTIIQNESALKIQEGQKKLSQEEQQALIKKIVVYSVIGVASITVIVIGVWAYKKYIKK